MSEFVSNWMDSWGYAGVALLMLLENIFPPIPSELVMPAAGASAEGWPQLLGYVLAGTIGSMLGLIPWYYLGKHFGQERLTRWAGKRGKWMGIRRRDMEQAIDWFDSWGNIAVLLGRMIPGVRTLISVPAGFSGMSWGRFLIYSSIGTLGWSTLLGGLGYLLGSGYEAVGNVVGWISALVVTLLVLAAFGFVYHRKRGSLLGS